MVTRGCCMRGCCITRGVCCSVNAFERLYYGEGKGARGEEPKWRETEEANRDQNRASKPRTSGSGSYEVNPSPTHPTLPSSYRQLSRTDPRATPRCRARTPSASDRRPSSISHPGYPPPPHPPHLPHPLYPLLAPNGLSSYVDQRVNHSPLSAFPHSNTPPNCY